MPSVYDYIIQNVGDPALKQAGRTAALGNYGQQQLVLQARQKRFRQLNSLIDQGKIKSQDLGPNDRTLIASGQPLKTPFGDVSIPKTSFFKRAANIPTNFMKDVVQTGLGLVPGLYTMGESIVSDAYHQRSILDPKNSKIRKNIIDPTVAGIKYDLGGGPGTFWEHFQAHPLGPILDVASVASLGLGSAARLGSMAARTGRLGGEAGTLARARTFTAREGRAPLTTDVGREIPREYTPRPLPRLGQKFIVDPIAERVPQLKRLQLRIEENRQSRGAFAMAQHERFNILAALMEGTDRGREFLKLDPNEQHAFFLLKLGVNTPRRIAAFESMVKRKSLSDPDVVAGMKEAKGIDPRYVEHQANLPTATKELVLNPSDDMITASRLWDQKVDQLRAMHPEAFEPTALAAHIREPQDILDRHLGKMNEEFAAQGRPVAKSKIEDRLPHAGFPIEPNYVPTAEAIGFEPARGRKRPDDLFLREPSRINRILGRGIDVPDRKKVGLEEGFINKPQKYLHESQFEAFRAGTFRTDTRALIDHFTQRAKADAEKIFRQERLQKVALRDPETGQLLRVKDLDDPRLAKMGLGPKNVEIVNDGFMVQWFKKSIDHMEKVRDVVNTFVRDLDEDSDISSFLNDPEVERMLEQITEVDAKAFITQEWNAEKNKGYVVPKNEAKQMMQYANLDIPVSNPFLRFLGTWMNRWRNFVLTYMPRWWINTAAGSFIMNLIQGVNPGDYMVAAKLQKAGALPARVNLGHQPLVEYQESLDQYGRTMGMSLPTEELQNFVQNIENHFRRAAYIHHLKRTHRLTRDGTGKPHDPEAEQGQALVDIGESLQTHFEDILGKHHGNIAEALSNPQTVARALQEVDKFSYNYSILSPFERRKVRNFIPFWGWYKFISMAAFRLGVEMPGRVKVLSWLSNIAAEQEHDLGSIPPWVEGSIPLSIGGGRYIYLSGLGLNPFSNFFAPFGRRGAVLGAISPTQFNPLIQAGMTAFGYDPLSGGGTRISPESGLGTDFLGRLVSEATGQPVNLGEREGGWRALHALLFSIPQVRQGLIAEGGQFPESVPFIHSRPLPEGRDTSLPVENLAGGPFKGSGLLQHVLLPALGLEPRQYTARQQRLAQKAARDVQKKNRRQRARNP